MANIILRKHQFESFTDMYRENRLSKRDTSNEPISQFLTARAHIFFCQHITQYKVFRESDRYRHRYAVNLKQQIAKKNMHELYAIMFI